ncbi:hypothetical protein [uncultured Slackia sp.]|uniref:hypothetical protein n=1 Tax=uncultured Slackia sp. TaxID=665903 RepID=UPI002674C061|nr:hypothetical protein [uncultured Slackia sp.]
MGFNPFEQIGSAAADAGKFLQDRGNDIAKVASEGANAVAKGAAEGADAVAKAASEGAEAAAKAVTSGANQVAEVAAKGADAAVKIACAGANQFGNAAVDAGNKMANVLQENVAPALQQGVSDAAESANHLASSAKKSIFGSLLKEEMEAESFVLPKMINVVDASEKRTVDLEFGAIGWQSKEGKIKVLHIYEDALDIVPCDFYPSASSKSGLVFYVDQLNPHRYINLSKYFDIIADEKRAELLDIAYHLGAKHCHLECREEKRSIVSGKAAGKRTAKFQIDGVPVKVANQGEAEAEFEKYGTAVTLFSQEYSGSNDPQYPELHWYEHDPKILQLIEARCDRANELKRYSAEISDTQSVTFDLNVAVGIDMAIKKMGLASNFSFEGQTRQEKRRKLTFVVEF